VTQRLGHPHPIVRFSALNDVIFISVCVNSLESAQLRTPSQDGCLELLTAVC
jgi:hypothetical protein